MDNQDNKITDIKQQIIDAALARFALYGFNKTTMAEIAKDCNMSAGNIYRYFENKTDIVAECASIHFKGCEDNLRNVVRKKNLTTAEKLEIFFTESLEYTYGMCSDHPHISELVDYVNCECVSLVEEFKARKISLIAEIISEGNRTGEFNVPDVTKTAEYVLLSTIAFHAPPVLLMVKKCGKSFEDLQKDVKEIVGLLLNGLVGR